LHRSFFAALDRGAPWLSLLQQLPSPGAPQPRPSAPDHDVCHTQHEALADAARGVVHGILIPRQVVGLRGWARQQRSSQRVSMR
jgi:hypothetical protein